MTSPQTSSGDERETAAQHAGDAAAIAIAGATALILAAMAGAILAVVAGSMTVGMAKRKVARAIAGALGGARARVRAVQGQAARQAVTSGSRAGGQRTRPGGTRSQRGGITLPGAPDATDRAFLTAQRDAGQAFDAALYAALGEKKAGPLPADNPYRAAVDKAMRRLTGIGADVKDLTGPERAAQSLSRLQAAQQVMNDLAAQGITGYTDTRGRRWSLDAYAEMATRTAASRMHLSAQIAAMGPAGFDLVVIDDPSMTAPCPKCRPWQGKVVSLSGGVFGSSTITDASGQVRSAQIAGSLADTIASGLFHVNCRCGMTPWHDGAAVVATAGGQPRGYVDRGQPVYRQLPIGSPADYDAEQKLRAHERAVRKAHARVAASLTPLDRQRARRHLGAAQDALQAHVRQAGVTRLPHRERAGKAR